MNQALAENMAAEFFTMISDARNAGQNPVFDEIKWNWDREDPDDPEHLPENSRYIMYGKNTHILDIFPR